MRITASEVAQLANGRLVGNDAVADGVWFDTRVLRPSQAFVAIVDERDGNDHVQNALEAGAAFALVSRGRAVPGITCVVVDDTLAALAAWGRHARERLDATAGARIVGITGSAGKTSTKNLVRAVLARHWQGVHAARNSLNNDIGVPVTLVNAPADADAVVLEMGMRGFHEIERLCGVAFPTVGVITNIGDAHGERVGGAAGIARAKGELFDSLPAHGTAVVNADDPWCDSLAARAHCRVVTFGRSERADMRWTPLSTDATGRVTVRLEHAGDSAVATPALAGAHMAANAAAAVLVGVVCGMSLTDAAAGIGQEEPEFGRMVMFESGDGRRIVDDSYNANTGSMLAALETVAAMQGTIKRAVLGRMSEVSDAGEAHRTVADRARELGIDLIALETDSYGTVAMSLESVLADLRERPWDVLLVKGSRAAATERVVQALLPA